MGEPKFLNFDQAVELSELLVRYSNSPQGREAFEKLGAAFNEMKVKDGYSVNVAQYERNCPDCTGCDEQGCKLGCFKTPSNHICYWDQALEKIIGTKLVTHEFAHVWYDQVFTHGNLDAKEQFKESEKFAQFVENNFTDNLVWCGECKQFEVLLDISHDLTATEGRDRLIDGLIFGFGLGISGAIIAFIISRASRKKNLHFINSTS